MLAVITILMSILAPSLNKAKRQVRRMIGAGNQRQIIEAMSLYAFDNNGRFPDSVATIGQPWNWNWTEPMMLAGYYARSPGSNRSMGQYLNEYIENADIIYCSNAPKKYKYLQEAWDAGDAWDNPDTGPVIDSVSGTYCFYGNYTGYLDQTGKLFMGPSLADGSPRHSKLMVSDYFGFDHHRSRNSFGSCEKFNGTSITQGSQLSSAYWSRLIEEDMTKDTLEIKLTAGYTDGHVESYSNRETVSMRVIWRPQTNEPYPEGVGPGQFFLPQEGIR